MQPRFGGAARDLRAELGLPDAPARETSQARRSSRLPWVIVILAACALVAVLVLVGVRISPVTGGVAIDSSTFPDAALRAVVRTYDADGNGALSSEELASITSIDCSGRSVASLEGISRLTSLQELDASNNMLTMADLSANGSLTSVDLSNNSLVELTLGTLGLLSSLDVSNNQLTTLDLANCASLESLDCQGNALARLDLSHNAQLTSLSTSEGQNVTIPIAAGFFPDEGLRASLAAVDTDGDGALSERERSQASALVVSDASTADLTGLTWLSSLSSLDISDTQVATISSESLPSQLTSLVAKNCPLASVDVSGLARLHTLDLSGSEVSSLDLSALERLTSLNVSGCSQLAALDIGACAASLTGLWCDASLAVTGGVAATSAIFPDGALREAVFASAANANGDDLLTAAELANLTSLDLTGVAVTNLQGLEALPSLVNLTCRNVALGTFDCEGLTALASLSLINCSLTEISLEGAASLVSLDVSNNNLTELTCSVAPNLALVVATDNPNLTQIDATGCAALADGQNISCDASVNIVLDSAGLVGGQDAEEAPAEVEEPAA